MIRNDGRILFEDPDIIAKGSIPPCDSLIFLFPQADVDGRLYVWEVQERNDSGVFRASDPVGVESYNITASVNQVVVTPVVPRNEAIDIELHGHLLGDHRLLPKAKAEEHKGLLTSIVFNREAGDTLDLTTYDWLLYRWQPDEREFVLEPSANYGTVEATDSVTVTLTNPVTSWIATRLLGFDPSTTTVVDEKVKVSSNDTTTDFLLSKLQAGTGITLSEINDGGNEKVEIASTGETFPATCLATDAIGDAVYVTADRIGANFQVTKVDIDSTSIKISMGTGIIVTKPTSTTCTVQTSGRVTGVLTGMTPGLSLFIQTDASLGHTPPSGPGSGRRNIQAMGYALAADVLLVRPWPPTRRRA